MSAGPEAVVWGQEFGELGSRDGRAAWLATWTHADACLDVVGSPILPFGAWELARKCAVCTHNCPAGRTPSLLPPGAAPSRVLLPLEGDKAKEPSGELWGPHQENCGFDASRNSVTPSQLYEPDG